MRIPYWLRYNRLTKLLVKIFRRSGEPVNKEPDKCEGWEWITFDKLKELVVGKQAAQWIPLHYIELHRERIGI